jgi:hypothetical protein
MEHQGFTGLASEKKVPTLGNKYLTPCVEDFQYENKNVTLWYNYIDEAVPHFIELHYFNNSTTAAPPIYQSIDILWGGDHGQGSFCSSIKVILRGENSHVTEEVQIGELEAKRNSAETLEKTLIGPINESLDRMTGGKVCTGNDPDGNLRIFKRAIPDDSSVYAVFDGHNTDTVKQSADAKGVACLPFRLL